MSNKHTILVIDDNVHNCKTFGLFIEECGYTAILADSPELAFTALEKESPSLILLDILIHGNDGCQIVAEIKKNEKYKQIPVILITEKTDSDDTLKGIEFGAVDSICKPFDFSELKNRIKTHI